MTDDLVKRLRDYAEQWKVSTFPNIADEAADRIEALEKALRLGVDMREKQKTYFKDRSKENLIASKQAETAFDRAALRGKKDD
jgi:ribosome recycling factor